MSEFKLIVKDGTVVTPFEIIQDGAIAVDFEGKVAFVGKKEALKGSAETVISAEGGYIVPGFIDIHIHGSAGADTMDAKVESLEKIASFVASQGVTSFIPTTVTSPLDDIMRALKAIREAMSKGVKGAKILGAHLEGPYFSEEKAGAQDKRYLRKPSLDELESLLKDFGDVILRITLAPEIPGAIEAIKFLTERGVVAAVGHSNATYEQAIAAFDAGAKIANHLYNGMRAFHHREPGIIGASLVRDDVYAEIIVDSAHHHNAARIIALRCKGPDRIILITDAIMAAGLPDGEYQLGRQKIIIKNGVSRLPDGTLAGSTLTMIQAVKNVIEFLGVSLRDAVKMASYNPAKAMNLKNKGALKPGYDGDITVLTKDLRVKATIVEGELVYSADS